MSEASLSLQIANYLQSVQRAYPYGAPRVERKRKIIFYSRSLLTKAESQLVSDVALKGLQLSAEGYLIIDTGDVPKGDLVVVFGGESSQEPASHGMFYTFAVAEILSDTSKKRIFWEELKRLWQHT